MKIVKTIKDSLLAVALIVLTAHCNKDITEFGNDAAISGTVKDQSGDIVAGNITSNNLVVQALGENDLVATDMRVKGDGTFQNSRLFPKKYKIWITGPVSPTSDTLLVDFSLNRKVEQDITVDPFISIKMPTTSNVTDSSADVSFEMTPNGANTVSVREIYCSTNPYPDASTGSGPFYDTKVVAVDTDIGTVRITGLTPKQNYYIRIGAQATDASGFNYSAQILISTL